MRRVGPADEHGAVAVTIAMMLVALLGAVALAVDLGALYVEKRELQNGADAGALAIGQDCAANPASAGCSDHATALGTARAYAIANARDRASTVCGPDSSPASCPNADGVVFDYAANKVTVTVDTEDPSSADPSRLAHWFAPLLDGDATAGDATAVEAKSVAIWGPVALSGQPHIPVTIGICEWAHWTAQGTKYYYPADIYPAIPEPLIVGSPYPFVPPDKKWDRFNESTGGWDVNPDLTPALNQNPVALLFQAGNPMQPEYCQQYAGPAGQNLPGGFGGLATDSTCTVESLEGIVDSSGGSLIENNDCKDYCTDSASACKADPLMILGKVVYLPIFDAYDGKTYNLVSPAAFYVTSYEFGGGKYNGTLPNWQNCYVTYKADCLEGYFTRAEPSISGQVDVGGYDTGMRTTQLVLE